MKKVVSFVCLMLMFLLGRAEAQVTAQLYAVTFYNRQLITIETNTAIATLVTNLPFSPHDIAVHHGELWASGGGSGVESFFQLDGWTGAVLAQRMFTSSAIGGEGSLDFATNGIAYATKSSGGVGTFFRVDFAQTNSVLITDTNALSPSLDGLAFDNNGVLYALSQNAGAFTLFTLNTNTGETTAVGPLGITFPGTGGAVAGLAFAPDGALFAAAGNPTESRLYRVNKFTGAATLVAGITFPGISGLRFFAPPPGPLTIATEGTDVRITWPHARGGVLQSSPSIDGSWTNVIATLTTNGVDVSVLVPANFGESYFRLAR
jgi:hypothetical protein